MVKTLSKEEIKVPERPSVMICMPSKGETMSRTMNCLLDVITTTVSNGVKTTITFAEGTLVSAVRSKLVETFLKSEYDYLFFIDSDMTFKPDIILRLVEHNQKIVCGVAKVRGGHSFNIYSFSPEKQKYIPVSEIKKDALVEIDATGMACILIHREVFERVMKEKEGLNLFFERLSQGATSEFQKAYYENLSKDNGAFVAIGEKSEDIAFLELAKSLGYKIMCDTGVRLGHLVHTELDPYTPAEPKKFGEQKKKNSEVINYFKY